MANLDPTRAVLDAVGTRLRALRQQRDVTLADLSTETGISVSTLSRLESGGRKPTLELLLPLARAHGVPLDDLVGAPQTGDPRIHIKPVRRHGQTILPLSRGASGVQVFKHLFAESTDGTRSADDRDPTPRTHEGHEWVYVIRGRLRLIVGDRDMVLESGEAAEFDTTTPHWFGRADQRAVEFLSLFGRQGERMHVRS